MLVISFLLIKTFFKEKLVITKCKIFLLELDIYLSYIQIFEYIY